jgi:hypothetical protein
MSIIIKFLKNFFGIKNSNPIVEPERIFTGSNFISGHPFTVYVLNNGSVEIIFKDKQYLFENPFGQHLSGTFQLFVQDNIVVLFSGHMFVSFVFEKGEFSKIEFKQYNAWPYKLFVKENVILLSIGRRILSFTLENERFTMRNYSIIHGIDGGILTLVGRTPYFVYCIHPHNSELSVVVIDLRTGQLNTVLKMGEDEHFDSFISLPDGKIVMNTRNPNFKQSKIQIDTNPWKYVFNKTLKELLEKFTKQ